MVNKQVNKPVKLEVCGSRNFTPICSANSAVHPLEVRKWVLKRNPEGTDLKTSGPH